MPGTVETKIVPWGNSAGVRLTTAVLKEANLHVNDRIRITISDGEIVIRPSRRRTLDEMLALCDPSIPMSEAEKEWLNAPPAGKEII